MPMQEDFTNYPRPSWLPDIGAYRTPQEDWQRFTSTQNPFWQTRAPLQDVGANMQARYLLSAPYMAEQMGQRGANPTFSQFISDYQPQGSIPQAAAYMAQSPQVLLARARDAANAAITAPGPYLANKNYAPGTPEWDRRAWLSSQFGADAQGAQANQLAVANLLALQRPQGQGDGQYRGRMADAIRGAMSQLQQQRINTGAPRESFLDWYLNQRGA